MGATDNAIPLIGVFVIVGLYLLTMRTGALRSHRSRGAMVFALITWASLGVFVNSGAAQVLRWETSPAPGRAIAIVGHHVVVGGATLAAYDTRSGEKDWETSSNPPADITALVAERHRVFAGGNTGGPFPQFDGFVAAFDPETGAQLWSDLLDYSSGREFVDAIVAQRGRVFVVGTTRSILETGARAFIRAYDAETGARLWQDVVDLMPEPLLAVDRTATDVEGQVYLVGGITSTLCCSPFVIRAYNARTGALVWQDALSSSDGATVVAADHRRVFTGGTTVDQIGFRVRAYDRRDGRLMWQDSFSGGDINFVTGIALHQGRLIVSGLGLILNPAPPGDEPNFGSFVTAYDPKTGTVLWEETPFGVGRGLFNLSLAVARNSVFVAGSRTVGIFGPQEGRFSVRALDIETGDLQWEDLPEGVPGAALAVETGKGLTIAVGELTDPAGAEVSVIRAYGAGK